MHLSRARGSAIALSLLTLALAAPHTAPGGASAATPTEPAVSDPPNVVLVLTDDQTMHTLQRMPYLASQQWVNFPNAVVENGLCCPSRATVLTGQYDTRTGVLHNGSVGDFDPRETIATALQRSGYRTAHIGKYLNMYDGVGVPPGWDDWQVPFSTALYKQYRYPLSNNGKREWYGDQPDDYQVDVLADKSIDFIRTSAQQGSPFFLLLSPSATHTPWTASPSRQGMYAQEPVVHTPAFNEADVSDKPRYIRTRPKRDVATMTNHRRAEMAAARSVDDALARVDGALKTAGVYDDTMVIYMTDNGYALGDHRWLTKRCQYDECLRTPMLVRYPGVGAKRINKMISNIDVAPTIMAATGATTTLRMDGKSFLPFVTGTSSPPWRGGALIHWPGGNTTGLSGKPDSIPQFWGVRTVKDKYVELDTGEKEYYDLLADPYELQNQIGNPQYAARIDTLRTMLVNLKKSAGASALATNTSMPGPGEFGTDLD